jgi:hypothetical protein
MRRIVKHGYHKTSGGGVSGAKNVLRNENDDDERSSEE